MVKFKLRLPHHHRLFHLLLLLHSNSSARICASAQFLHQFPAPVPPAEVPSPPLPPLVSEIFDGQLQSPEEPTPEPEPIVFPLISEIGNSQIQVPETTPPWPSLTILTPVISPTPTPCSGTGTNSAFCPSSSQF